MKRLALYFHTLKYLKPTQVYYRVLKRFTHPKINLIKGERVTTSGEWQLHELYSQKFMNETDVKFLNHSGQVNAVGDWNNEREEKLWLYNLHYFDDLNAFDFEARNELQSYWINKWIDENPATEGGNGWEPYTLSLRIVNWTKAFLSGLTADDKMLNSLAQQADYLSQDLEKHLLGNHYFVNLKALFFAACFLEGKTADTWLSIALKDFKYELEEQVLNDGGSFELTPMYHSIMLTDLLDLANLFNTFPNRVSKEIICLINKKIKKMLYWSEAMSLGDDEVSFFNDSAFGIAPSNKNIRCYANKLGVPTPRFKLSEEKLSVYNLSDTGYVSVKSSDVHFIADLAEVGPSYIPGHAHADSLSFELSLGESRLFVNSGTSMYGMSEERIRQRGTKAHNTVCINNINSSEVWSGFRVARRANIVNRNVSITSDFQNIKLSATHNGYQKQGLDVTHKRSWEVSLNSLLISDQLEGKYETALGFLHLHPKVTVAFIDDNSCVLYLNLYEVHINVTGATLSVESSTWHPEFGTVIQNSKLVFNYEKPNVTYSILWKKQ